jgi:2-dehydro-3-deoxyphosphogluconate aldolase / (4S)-4-hydroxy-2-oxoglutarate aldolase
MIQNGILAILEANTLIPVVTFKRMEEVDEMAQKLIAKEIKCIEVTLRSEIAMDAIRFLKEKYGHQLKVGAGTVVNQKQVDELCAAKIDFIVSPGSSATLIHALLKTDVPFITGVVTPSDILQGLELGCTVFKFFPANLFGGAAALKTYGQVFPQVKFCPTGGINADTKQDYLQLANVVSVGGSWMID